MNDRTSRPSFSALPTAGVRLANELSKHKISPEGLLRSGVDPTQAENLMKMLRLASFIETSSDFIMIIDSANTRLYYANPAATQRFPDLQKEGANHSAVLGWRNSMGKPPHKAEFRIGESTFVREFSCNGDFVKVSLSEKKSESPQKDQSPMMNPFPVIEYSLAMGRTIFRNDAARKQLGEITPAHPILSGLNEMVRSFREGRERLFVDSVNVEGKTFKRGITYVAHGDSIRVYAADMSDVASACKIELIALRSAVKGTGGLADEQVRELEKKVQALYGTARREKGELAKVELEMSKLLGLLRNFTLRQPSADERISLRSVLAHTLDVMIKNTSEL